MLYLYRKILQIEALMALEIIKKIILIKTGRIDHE